MAITLNRYRADPGDANDVMFRWTRDAGDAPGGWRLHDSSTSPVPTDVTWNVVNGSGTPIAGSARSYRAVDYTSTARYLRLVALSSGGAVVEVSNEVSIADGGIPSLPDDPGAGGTGATVTAVAATSSCTAVAPVVTGETLVTGGGPASVTSTAQAPAVTAGATATAVAASASAAASAPSASGATAADVGAVVASVTSTARSPAATGAASSTTLAATAAGLALVPSVAAFTTLVPAPDRTLTVAAELRSWSVPAETRILEVLP